MRIDITRPLNRLTALLLAVIITALAFLAALIAENARDIPLDSAVRVNVGMIRDVQVQGDRIYCLENGGTLRCIDESGKFVWNVSVDPNAGFRVSNRGLAVWSGSRLSIFDRNTGVVIGSYSAQGEILSAIVGDVYAAAVLGPEHESNVVLTDRYGSVIDTLTEFKGVTVLDCGFFEGRELFWIMTLDATGSLPTCRIKTYKPGKKETGSIIDMEQVLYSVMFRSSFICAVGTDYLREYDYTGAEKSSQMVTGFYLTALDQNSEDPLMLFVPNSQNAGEISDVRCLRGSSFRSLHMPVKCTGLQCYGDTVYGFSQTQVAVGSYSGGGVKLYNLPVAVNEVLGVTENRVAVASSGSSIYLINLPEE
ncbi:MAG: hypothetical protein IKR85_05050 [Clostridia bacterium]|nr:hypothetical protein [Clostridia bacterium]